jgi:drug/metabolite transporter, DME family
MSIRSNPLRGYLYIASATFLWGISATLGRAAFTGRLAGIGVAPVSVGPLILSQSRTTFSFLLLLPILAMQSRAWRLRMPPAEVGRTFLMGVLGNAAANYFYYLAIQRTNVATAIVLQYTAPVWVLLYAVARGQRRPAPQRVAAVALAVVGIAMVIDLFGAGGLRLDAIGVAAGLLSAFSFAFHIIFSHSILARNDRWTVLLYTTLGGSLFWLLVNPPWKIAAAHFTGGQWLFLLVFAMLSVLLPLSLYYAGLEHLEPTRAIVVSCLEPVFSIVIAAAALRESIRFSQTAGIAIVLLASLFAQLPDRKARETSLVVEPID